MKRKRLDYSKEKQILVNLILNDEFCDKVLPALDERYFKSRYVNTLIHWVRTYHEMYNKAPKMHINQIFETESGLLEEDEVVQVENVLQDLSELAQNEVHNVTFLIDNTYTYLEDKHITLKVEAAQHFIASKDFTSAKRALTEEFVGISGSSYEVLSFGTEEARKETIRWMIMQGDLDEAFFRFNGRLGDFLGPIDSGWFISFLAPAKRGKTTYMLDAAISALHQGLNTLVFSHEMRVKELHARYLTYITGSLPERKAYTAMNPIMDCLWNQDGSCEKQECVNSESLFTGEEGNMLTYTEFPEWEVCVVCRGTSDFNPSAWKIPQEKEQLDEDEYNKKAKVFDRLYGKHCRALYMPSNTVGVAELKDEMENLVQAQNFIPDVIVIDYADLLLAKNSYSSKRHELDEIWEDLRSWAKSSNILIITASQTNRSSANAMYLRDTDVSEDYSKIAKLDIAIGLCQTDTMKEMGMMNINKIAHRHYGYVQSHVCTVLQDMEHQQSSLDSEFVVK